MKNSHIAFSTFLLCSPMLYVWLLWDRLPDRLPVHFGNDGQPDQFASRQVWVDTLITVMITLILFRSVFIFVINKRFGISGVLFLRIYLLSAAFVGSILGLVVIRAIYLSTVFTDFMPVLMALFGASSVYCIVPADLPAADESAKSDLPPRQVMVLQQMHTLSRLVIVRVNILAALLMLFSYSADRWTIAITANILALVALFFWGVIIVRRAN